MRISLFSAFAHGGAVLLPLCLAMPVSAAPIFQNLTSTHVPSNTSVHSMDAEFGDFDKDGDLDVVIAAEMDGGNTAANNVNRLYLNDGTGRLTLKTGAFGNQAHDTEDLQVADFNGDGFADVVFVAEEDMVYQLFLGDGQGAFRDSSSRLPRNGQANDVEVADVNEDGRPDIIVGNANADATHNGQDFIFINDAQKPGFFKDETSTRMPASTDMTQDIKLADLDGDGDLDMVVGNEVPPNKLYINKGKGVFVDSSRNLDLPVPLETREVLLFDVDGDKDNDIVFANLTCNACGQRVKDPQARILINDGKAHFKDETAARMPVNAFSAWDAGYLDFDADGDVDIILCAIVVPGFQAAPFRAYRNDGKGVFSDATTDVFPANVSGYGWDVEVGDLNKDGALDLFLSSRASQNILLTGTVKQPTPIFPESKRPLQKRAKGMTRLWTDASGRLVARSLPAMLREIPLLPIFPLR